MILRATFLLATLLFVIQTIGQTRILTGRVIDDNFQSVYQARIFNSDTILLAETDLNGNFNIDIPSDTITLIVAWVAMEWKNIKLTDDCPNLEIILQPSVTYDFISARKIDRLRKKEFKKLPALHQKAFEKGIFKINRPCYVDNFISIRERLKKIHKNRK
jgi:hypothetical protein